MWQQWTGKGALLQQGAIPAVCAEVKAFEAPHEKCQNMQGISLNHRGFKMCPSDSERTQLASPREEEQNLVPSGSGLDKASSALAGQCDQP